MNSTTTTTTSTTTPSKASNTSAKHPATNKRDRGSDDQHSRSVAPKSNSEAIYATSVSAALMPKAVATKARQNGCWVPPVVALARFYNLTAMSTGLPITMENIAALRQGDEPEECCEIFEEAFGIWLADKSFSNHADFMEVSEHFTYYGSTSLQEYGMQHVSKEWFDELKRTIDQDDAVLLLVARQEKKDLNKTHYLLVLGYEEKIQRRGGHSFTLYIKDPTEGNELLVAKLWEETNIELCTLQGNGRMLDRYMILEAIHLSLRRDLSLDSTQ